MAKVIVGVADMKLSRTSTDVVITYALGSCLGITMYDPVAHVGGLLHVMQPASTLDPERAAQNPFVFVDSGVTQMLRAILAAGGRRERLVIKAAGGAHTQSGGMSDHFQIGKRNFTILQNVIRNFGLVLHRYDVGGSQARTMSLDLSNGVVDIKTGGSSLEL